MINTVRDIVEKLSFDIDTKCVVHFGTNHHMVTIVRIEQYFSQTENAERFTVESFCKAAINMDVQVKRHELSKDFSLITCPGCQKSWEYIEARIEAQHEL